MNGKVHMKVSRKYSSCLFWYLTEECLQLFCVTKQTKTYSRRRNSFNLLPTPPSPPKLQMKTNYKTENRKITNLLNILSISLDLRLLVKIYIGLLC